MASSGSDPPGTAALRFSEISLGLGLTVIYAEAPSLNVCFMIAFDNSVAIIGVSGAINTVNIDAVEKITSHKA